MNHPPDSFTRLLGTTRDERASVAKSSNDHSTLRRTGGVQSGASKHHSTLPRSWATSALLAYASCAMDERG